MTSFSSSSCKGEFTQPSIHLFDTAVDFSPSPPAKSASIVEMRAGVQMELPLSLWREFVIADSIFKDVGQRWPVELSSNVGNVAQCSKKNLGQHQKEGGRSIQAQNAHYTRVISWTHCAGFDSACQTKHNLSYNLGSSARGVLLWKLPWP